jgi:nicotinate-nucleotide pyrophosphorylase (carboxylating)
MDRLYVRRKLEEYLLEDIGTGDITSEAVCTEGEKVRALILAKQDGILAGGVFVKEIFNILGGVSLRILKQEGESFSAGESLIELEGYALNILKGERLSLNLLQRLSGIATRTREFVKKLEGKHIKILDTRKTTPGFRAFEKYGVRVGGGYNHRLALYDMVLIKDNHKVVAGGLREAINRVRKRVGPAYKVEVEINSLRELEEAVELEVDIAMLDNFSPDQVREAVSVASGRVSIEVSGNITLDNIEEYAVEGVDYISSGSVIYSAPWIDLSLRVL